MHNFIIQNSLVPYLSALRAKQWTKNLVVFAAPLFAFQINWLTLSQAALAFVLFCLLSSSFYLLNDILDVDSDRRHPTKCKRPIAAGLISITDALRIAVLLLFGSMIAGWLYAPYLGLTLMAYGVLQVAYNLQLKHTVILDIVAIAIGFVLRAYAGAAATGIALSSWFLLCTAMLALFLGIEKRKAELRLVSLQGGKTRRVLQRYTLPLLTRMESQVTTGAIMSYALWSFGPVTKGAPTPWMLLTLPLVLYGIFRYQLLSDPEDMQRRSQGPHHGGKTERPEDILLTDYPLAITVILWVCAVATILLLHQRGVLI